MQNEFGQIPDGGLEVALKDREAGLMSDFGTAGIDSGSWSWLGPGNVGGRVRALYVHPTTPDIMVLGSASGGIWRTTNGGRSWSPVDDFSPAFSISSIVAHPSKPNRLFAGTGDLYASWWLRGAGIFRSLDAGKTWTRLSSTASIKYVNRLAIAPDDANLVIAATSSGIYRSTDAGNTWSMALGNRHYDVEWIPQIPGRLLSAGLTNSGVGKVFYSSNNGVVWFPSTGFPIANVGRIEIAVSSGANSVAYALVEYKDDQTLVYKSFDGGMTWQQKHSTTKILNKQGGYANTIWVSPNNANVVLAGGLEMYLSKDGGATFSQLPGLHVDHHFIVHHPSYGPPANHKVYACNDGGIYVAADILATPVTWKNLNNDLGITQFYGGAVGPTGILWGGTQDNGTQLKVASLKSKFTMSYGADGCECAADPSDWRFLYGAIQHLGLFRSTDGGQSAHPINLGIINETGDGNAPFIAPIELDRTNPQRMWVGSTSLWRTDNVKATRVAWTKVAAGVARAKDWVTAIGTTPGYPNIVYFGRKSGALYKSTNATAALPTWTRIDDPGIPDRMILKIVVSAIDKDDVYVSLGGYASGNVHHSSDGGQSWAALSGTYPNRLPRTPIRGLAVHSRARGWLYAGTEVGVYSSTDNGKTWSSSNAGPADVMIDELVLHGDDLWAFTHGRGVYRAHAGVDRGPDYPIYRASRDSLGVEGNSHSRYPTMTAEGRWIAFESDATNLVSNDNNSATDVFVRDRQTNLTVRVSLASDQGQAFTGHSRRPSMARNGRWVAYHSTASDLVAGDTNAATDVFLRDLQNKNTTRVSITQAGQQGNGSSFSPSISADGRYLAFTSYASNFAAGDTNGLRDVFRINRATGSLSLTSCAMGNATANGGSWTTSRCISDTGSAVVFTSQASNLVSGDTNGAFDVFVRRIQFLGSTTKRVSLTNSGAQANASSNHATIDAAGRFIVFQSSATNIIRGDNNGSPDIFLHDMSTGMTTLVSVSKNGGPGNGQSLGAVISPDGGFVVFTSSASDLVLADGNGKADVFVRDLALNKTYLVSRSARGITGNNNSFSTDIAMDGKHSAFWSSTTNLAPNDTNGRDDALVATLYRFRSVSPHIRTQADGTLATIAPLAWSNGRFQQAARPHSSTPIIVDKLSFRRDSAAPTNAFAYAHTIDLELRMGVCDIDSMTTTFDNNWKIPHTVVIQQKPVYLPDWRQKPSAIAPFDAHLVLDAPFSFSGADDLLWEIRVFGSNKPVGNYLADATDDVRSVQGYSGLSGPGCSTNNRPFKFNTLFTSNGTDSELVFTFNGAPINQTVHLMIGATNPNLQIPGICGAFYTDNLIQGYLGTSGRTGTKTVTMPLGVWNPSWAGTQLFLQVAALDPVVQRGLVLSDGAKLEIPVTTPGSWLRLVTGATNSTHTGQIMDWGLVFRIDGQPF